MQTSLDSVLARTDANHPEAIERLKQPPLDPEIARQEFDYVATKIGITSEELRRYLEQPNRTYRDFKSQENVYKIGARVMRMLGMELGGKR